MVGGRLKFAPFRIAESLSSCAFSSDSSSIGYALKNLVGQVQAQAHGVRQLLGIGVGLALLMLEPVLKTSMNDVFPLTYHLSSCTL